MVSYLQRQNAPDLAYVKIEADHRGASLPTLMFLGGFRSDMQGTKALFLQTECEKRGQGFIRFDYRGHGQSGGEFNQSCLGDWKQDVLDIFDGLTNGPVIVVGSSMGGWLAFLLQQERTDRVRAIVGIAAAPDFTKIIEEQLTQNQKDDIAKTGYFSLESGYDNQPYFISGRLLEEGRTHCFLHKQITIQCPVRLIQGKKDADVDWQTAEKIIQSLSLSKEIIHYIENGDHRLSRSDDLAVLNKTIESLL